MKYRVSIVALALVLALLENVHKCQCTVVEVIEDQQKIYQHLFNGPNSSSLATMPLCRYIDDGKSVVRRISSGNTAVDYLRRLKSDNASAIEISYGARILQLINLSEKEQTITLTMQIETRWTDCRLSWSLTDFGSPLIFLSVESFRSTNLFVPSVKLLEELDFKISSGSEVKVGINNDGMVAVYREYATTLSCNIDVTMYPFDTHLCKLTFEAAYGHIANALLPLATQQGKDSKRISMDLLAYGRFVPADTWELTVLPPKRKLVCMATSQCDCEGGETRMDCFYDRLIYTLLLRRHPQYQISNLIFPAFLVTIISGSVFIIPPGEADKMGLSVTILLSLFIFTQLMYDNMPDTGTSVPLTSRYYMLCILIVAISCIYSTVSATLQCSGTPVPKCLQKLVKGCCKSFYCGLTATHKGKQHQRIVTIQENQEDLADAMNNDVNQLDKIAPEATWMDVAVFLDRCFFILHFCCSCLVFALFVHYGYGPWKNGSYLNISTEDLSFIETQLAYQNSQKT